ncbi:sigma factor-like helix-turn-helix DNA-binding protein [Pseudonocardia sp. 1LY6.1]
MDLGEKATRSPEVPYPWEHDDDGDTDCGHPATRDTCSDGVEFDALAALLREQLTTAEAELLELLYLGHTVAEIAGVLGITAATARKRVSRMRGKLVSHFPAASR